MTFRILIMGLPGSGKTTLARELKNSYLKTADWFNADDIRKQYNDWDFSLEGRIRQAHRMKELAERSSAEVIMADFVAPLPEMREIYQADFTVWVDTINSGRYEDTNQMFIPPTIYDIRVTEKDINKWGIKIIKAIQQKHQLEV